MTAREIENRVKSAGWYLEPALGKGAHRVYRHSEIGGIVIIPWHKGDIPKGTANSILKAAGLK